MPTFATASAINAVARSAKRALSDARKTQSLNDAVNLFSDAGIAASTNISTRKALRVAKGMGAYHLPGRMDVMRRRTGQMASKGGWRGSGKYNFGKAMSKFGAGKFGQQLQEAFTNKVTGQGMYTGAGDYTESNNLISSKSSQSIIPDFSGDVAEAVVRVSRKEYVSEIYAPAPDPDTGIIAPFVLQSYQINPGLEKTFPWLSQIAQNYDEYEIQQLIFTFRSTTTESNNSVNGQVGTVIMATNYNAAAPVFQDKVTMMEYDSSMSGRVTESLLHGVECDPDLLSGSDGKYIRSNPIVANQDLKTYDHGKFQIALANIPDGLANYSLGELWVSYTVVLRKPKFFVALGLGISKDIFVSYGALTTTNWMGQASTPGAEAYLRGQQNNIGCRLVNSALSIVDAPYTITFPANYAGHVRVMTVQMFSTPPTTYTATAAIDYAGGNVTLVSDLYGSGTTTTAGDLTVAPKSQIYSTLSPGLSGGLNCFRVVKIAHLNITIATNGVDNTFTILQRGTNGTVLQSYIEIAEYNSGFSYKANGIGVSDAPILINAVGSVILV